MYISRVILPLRSTVLNEIHSTATGSPHYTVRHVWAVVVLSTPLPPKQIKAEHRDFGLHVLHQAAVWLLASVILIPAYLHHVDSRVPAAPNHLLPIIRAWLFNQATFCLHTHQQHYAAPPDFNSELHFGHLKRSVRWQGVQLRICLQSIFFCLFVFPQSDSMVINKKHNKDTNLSIKSSQKVSFKIAAAEQFSC